MHSMEEISLDEAMEISFKGIADKKGFEGEDHLPLFPHAFLSLPL